MEYYGKFPTSMKLAALGATLAAMSLSYIATSPSSYFNNPLQQENKSEQKSLLETVLENINLDKK